MWKGFPNGPVAAEACRVSDGATTFTRMLM
jgi:hypothetical protein